jgi:hypothetical protein
MLSRVHATLTNSDKHEAIKDDDDDDDDDDDEDGDGVRRLSASISGAEDGRLGDDGDDEDEDEEEDVSEFNRVAQASMTGLAAVISRSAAGVVGAA